MHIATTVLLVGYISHYWTVRLSDLYIYMNMFNLPLIPALPYSLQCGSYSHICRIAASMAMRELQLYLMQCNGRFLCWLVTLCSIPHYVYIIYLVWYILYTGTLGQIKFQLMINLVAWWHAHCLHMQQAVGSIQLPVAVTSIWELSDTT